MAKRQKPVDESDTAAAAGQAHAIITRLIEEEHLREAAARALESGRRVHDRVAKTRKTSKLLDDTQLHEDAAAAYEALRTLAAGLAGAAAVSRVKSAKRKRRRGRVVVVCGRRCSMRCSARRRSSSTRRRRPRRRPTRPATR
jgi:hypothetical protein